MGCRGRPGLSTGSCWCAARRTVAPSSSRQSATAGSAGRRATAARRSWRPARSLWRLGCSKSSRRAQAGTEAPTGWSWSRRRTSASCTTWRTPRWPRRSRPRRVPRASSRDQIPTRWGSNSDTQGAKFRHPLRAHALVLLGSSALTLRVRGPRQAMRRACGPLKSPPPAQAPARPGAQRLRAAASRVDRVGLAGPTPERCARRQLPRRVAGRREGWRRSSRLPMSGTRSTSAAWQVPALSSRSSHGQKPPLTRAGSGHRIRCRLPEVPRERAGSAIPGLAPVAPRFETSNPCPGSCMAGSHRCPGWWLVGLVPSSRTRCSRTRADGPGWVCRDGLRALRRGPAGPAAAASGWWPPATVLRGGVPGRRASAGQAPAGDAADAARGVGDGARHAPPVVTNGRAAPVRSGEEESVELG